MLMSQVVLVPHDEYLDRLHSTYVQTKELLERLTKDLALDDQSGLFQVCCLANPLGYHRPLLSMSLLRCVGVGLYGWSGLTPALFFGARKICCGSFSTSILGRHIFPWRRIR
jgi:hypothetical protein